MKTAMKILGILLAVGMFGWHSVSKTAPIQEHQFITYAEDFKELYRNIGDSLITPDSAARAFQANMIQLEQWGKQYADSCKHSNTYIFPIRGYLPQHSIGGKGRGYRPKGFDFFDARIRKSHPAQDLFIRDGNQDSVDDRKGMPVDVLALSSGIVLAIEKDWTPESEWRGGNFVWIYDPCKHALVYYAHNSTIAVEVGQWVHAGDKLAEVGRTGYNAMQPRSGTHLHLMYLQINNDQLPEPVDTYPWLLESTVMPWNE